MGVRIALLAAGWSESSQELESALKKFREAVRKRPTR
jgi:biotin operon repressor